MNQGRNIIVTGSNKGIGYGIVNHLAQSANWNIIMACRNVELANQAREEILAKNPGSSIHVESLDVSDTNSIDAFIPLIKEKYQHIDVLVNNAGIAAKGDAFDVDVFNLTLSTVIYLVYSRTFLEQLSYLKKYYPCWLTMVKSLLLGQWPEECLSTESKVKKFRTDSRTPTLPRKNLLLSLPSSRTPLLPIKLKKEDGQNGFMEFQSLE